MKKGFLFFISVTMTLMVVFSCRHHPDLTDILDNNNGGNINPPDTVVIVNPDPCDPDSVYFTNTILPILNSNCAQTDCHNAESHEDGVRLYDYAHIMQQVEAGDLGDSDLWEAINEDDEDDVMPPTDAGGPLSEDQIDDIRTWILQGAKNNSCTEDCDPLAFSFVTNIKPIIDLACSGCHSGADPSGTINLETHAQISSAALDGSLMSSLHGINGYNLMPDNTLGLPECYITQFQNWVDAGAANN